LHLERGAHPAQKPSASSGGGLGGFTYTYDLFRANGFLPQNNGRLCSGAGLPRLEDVLRLIDLSFFGCRATRFAHKMQSGEARLSANECVPKCRIRCATCVRIRNNASERDARSTVLSPFVIRNGRSRSEANFSYRPVRR
jgi:hypothetical protein